MIKIDNKRFVDAYLQCWTNAVNGDEHLASLWSSYHDWTVEHVNKILYPLAKAIGYCKTPCENCGNTVDGVGGRCKPNCSMYGLNLQQEYYKVDFSLYDYQAENGWSLDYAIEHENAAFKLSDGHIKSSGWFNEFMKLLPLNCANARVVIGYDDFAQLDEKLKLCMDRLQSPAVIPSLALRPILLIIFPYTNRMASIVETYPNNPVALLRAVEFVWSNGKWVQNDIRVENERDMIEAYAKIIKANK